MGELIIKTNIKPKEGYLYYVKPKGENGCIEVYETKLARGRRKKIKK